MGLFESIARQVLTEDKVTDYIKKLVVNNVDDEYKPYLKNTFKEVPSSIREKLHDDNEAAYSACMEHDMNLTHYFRLVFLKYFGLNHGQGPINYTVGLARIAIEELKLLKENHNHDDMSKLRQMVNFINEHQDLLKVNFDKDLNGLHFKELKDIVLPVYEEFVNNEKEKLSDVKQEKSDYKIVPIMCYEDAMQYGEYTSWCVTHAKSHFDSYTREGERFYFCLKPNFEKVKPDSSETPPLDTYGLSMISVLVDMDGNPVHITTRWNHEHDGEDNPDLCTAEQVQNIIGVNFYETFKPFTKEELQALRDNGSYEEDEDVRHQRYDDRRYADGLTIFDGNISILRPFDSDYVFVPGEDYNIYDIEGGGDEERMNSYFVKKEPIWIDNSAKLAIFQQTGEDAQTILRGGDIYCPPETWDDVTSYKIVNMPMSLETVILFIQDNQNVGYVCENGDANTLNDNRLSANHNNYVPGNADEQIIVRDDIVDYDDDIIYFEFVRADGLHCLYSRDSYDNFVTLICDFPPDGYDKLVYDSKTDTIFGVTRKISLSSSGDDENNDSEYVIDDIVTHLFDDYYIVKTIKKNGLKLQNIIKRGQRELLVKPDAERIQLINGISRYIVLKLSDSPKSNNNLDVNTSLYRSVLYDLELQKVVSRVHELFAYCHDLVFCIDDTYDYSYRKPTYVFNPRTGIEAGPFKISNRETCKYGKFVDLTDGTVNIYDSNTFKIIKKFEKWLFIPGQDGTEAIMLMENNKIFLYLYKTLELLDEKPIGNMRPMNVNGYLYYSYEQKTFDNFQTSNIFDFHTWSKFSSDPRFSNGLINLKIIQGKCFSFNTSNNFLYLFDTGFQRFLPTKNGIDLKYVSNVLFAEPEGIRLIIQYNGKEYVLHARFNQQNDREGAKIGIKEVNSEPGFDIYNSPTVDIQQENPGPELMKVIEDTIYPAQKAEVAAAFNEMINKFNKIRNGSILN